MLTYNFANEGLRGQKTTNFLAGVILALAAVFVALEYTQRVVNVIDEDIVYDFVMEEDMIPLTFHQETMAAPPAAAPTVMEFINEVQDDVELPLEEFEVVDENVLTNLAHGPIGSGLDDVYDGPVGPIPPPIDEPLYEMPEVPAAFPGDIHKWLSEHLKYPAICQAQNVQGRVIVSFIVNKDGSIEDVQTLRSPDPALSKEAERVVMLMPKWTPARQGHKNVKSRFNLPVMFRLN